MAGGPLVTRTKTGLQPFTEIKKGWPDICRRCSQFVKDKIVFFSCPGVNCAKYPSPLEAEVLADVIRGKKLKRGEKKRRQEESQRIKGTLKLQE